MTKRVVARLVIFALVISGAASTSAAQELQPLRVNGEPIQQVLANLPRSTDSLTSSPSPSGQSETRPADKKITALAAALYASMIIDTKSTYDSKAWCPRCVESNPYAAPFINAGPATAYSAGIAFDTGIIYLAMKMRTSRNPALRKIWFVMPALLTAGHVLAARHNYGLRQACANSPACGNGGSR